MAIQVVVRKRPLWISGIIIAAALLFFVGAAALWIWNIWLAHTQTLQTDIISAIFVVLGVVFAFLQFSPLLIPVGSIVGPEVSLANKLSREDLKMGSNDDAYFTYVKTPIKDVYDSATQALGKISKRRRRGKYGLLVLGEANAGKTRLIVEALEEALPKWFVFRVRALSAEQRVELPYRRNVVVFIDDLQQYVSAMTSGTDGSARARNREAEVLRDLLDSVRRAARQVLVVVACRIEDKVRVQAVFSWLFDNLEVVELPRFNPDAKDAETARIIDEFKKKADENKEAADEKEITVHDEDWDGTLGSLVLGLSKKKEQYHNDLNEMARTVLRAMKLLTYVGINEHTETRIRSVCAGVFYDKVLQENEKTWREVIDQLKQMQFVTVNVSRNSSKVSLIIRKDTYFDKVIDNYLMEEDDEYQFLLDTSLLQDVLVELKDVQGLFSLGDTLAGFEKYEKALAVYDQALKIDSTNVDGWNHRGLTLGELGRDEEGLASYERALSINPNVAYICCNKAVALANLNRYEEALATLDETLKIDATNPTAWSSKVMVLVILGRYPEAMEASQRAVDSDPNDASIWINRGDVLTHLGLFKEALAAYNSALNLDSQSAEAWRDKGNVLEKLEQLEEALKAYDNALQHNPQFAEAWFDKGSLLSDLDREQEALEAFDHALEIDPSLDMAWFLKSISLIVLNRYQEALMSINKSLDIDPDVAVKWSNKGQILAALEQYEDALKALDHALEIDPDNARLWSVKGDVLLKLKRYDEALAAIDRTQTLDLNVLVESAVNLSKMSKESKLVYLTDVDVGLGEEEQNNTVAWVFRAGMLVSLNRLEEALSASDHALKLDPHFVRAWLVKCDVFVRMGQFDQAFEAVEQALKLDSEHTVALLNKSVILLLQKGYEAALEAIDHTLRTDPDLSIAWNIKGNILVYMKRYEDALQAFDHLLTLDPKNAVGWSSKGGLLFMLGQYEEGFSAIQHASALRPDLLAEQVLNSFASDTPLRSGPLTSPDFTSMDVNDANAWIFKGSVLFGQKRFEEALSALDQALQLNPELALAWNVKGNILGLTERNKEALDAFEHAVALNPNFDQAWINKGTVLCKLGRYKEGVEDLNRAFTLNPKNTSVWMFWANLSEAYIKLKQSENALGALEHMLAIEQDLPLAWYMKGNVLTKLKRRDEAFRSYERAFDMDPALAKLWRNKWTVFRLWLWKRQAGSKVA